MNWKEKQVYFTRRSSLNPIIARCNLQTTRIKHQQQQQQCEHNGIEQKEIKALKLNAWMGSLPNIRDGKRNDFFLCVLFQFFTQPL